MLLQVARIGKPHGIKGDLTVQVMTDDPDSRFTPGAQFSTEPAAAGPLTIKGMRWNKDILLLSFEEVSDRNKAETLRGVKLFADTEELDDSDEDAWYEHELVGLDAVVDGVIIGKVSGLITMSAQDLLEISLNEGEREVLVPFVEEIVPEVDVDAGRVTLTPPPGLFELNGEG